MAQKELVNPYADFDFYQNVFHGTQFQDEETFDSFAVKAADMLDVFTWQRIPKLEEKMLPEYLIATIRKAVCAMAECEETSNPASLGISAGITSESNDGYSVSFGNAQQAQEQYEDSMKQIAYRYLAESGLLYRGRGEWHE